MIYSTVLLQLFCCFSLFLCAFGHIHTSRLAVRFTDTHNTTTHPLPSFHVNHKTYFGDQKTTTVGFEFENIIDVMFNEHSKEFDAMIREMPKYYSPNSMAANKATLRKRMQGATPLKKYEILMTGKTYIELVHLPPIPPIPYPIILSGNDAHVYLNTHFFNQEDLLPFTFAFETVRRLATPANMLHSLMVATQDPQNEQFKRRVDKKGATRDYIYNTNDTPKHYSPDALSKLFPPLPTHITSDTKYTHMRDTHTPIESVHVHEFEFGFDDYYLQEMRFYSKPMQSNSTREEMEPYLILQLGGYN
eukprot:GDKI01043953.1.p1 GENE.GDKI01043953.1~~GDKI01043953.1.p1  ORF type:complete len:304 (+),score=56.51 GDKI01043953.1:183-1094(+)